MKNIIKTAICLIVISSILLYSSVSKAAVSYNIVSPLSPQAYLIDSVVEDDHRSATYEYKTNLTFEAQGFTDGYISGYYAFTVSYTPVTPGNWQFMSGNVVFDSDNNLSDCYKVCMLSRSGRIIRVILLIENLPCFHNTLGRIDLGEFTWTFSFYTTQQSQNSVNTTVSLTYAIENINSNLITTANPIVGQGWPAIIKQCITESLADSNLDDVYSILNLWKTTQDGYLADIELSVDDIELWLNMINSAQATLQQKVDLIYALEQTFPGYFNSVISLLQQIRDMNASDTAAESQMQNAEQQLSQAVNDMEVQKPNINNVVNAGDQYMDSNITGAQGDTFFWLHGSNIFVTILTMAVTIGILGFVIYGKSG